VETWPRGILRMVARIFANRGLGGFSLGMTDILTKRHHYMNIAQ
jgi:hypothetical protein